MSIITYSESHEAISRVISRRTMRAYALHTEVLTFKKRLQTIRDELREVEDALDAGDHNHALYECGDVGATLYRLMEELQRFDGVRLV